MLGIIAAMDTEAARIVNLMTNCRQSTIGNKKAYSGTINNKPAAIIISGCGKVNAAFATTILLTQGSIKSIIMVGVAGALSSSVKIGDIVIGNSFIQHDMDARPLCNRFEIPYGEKSLFYADNSLFKDIHNAAIKTQKNVVIGQIASGDLFLSNTEQKKDLLSVLNEAVCVDMETAAAAQVCKSACMPFGAARIISDTADNSAHVDFKQFVQDTASTACAEIIQHIVS
jgi:adenosylhomocysteine nucleosidase